MCQEVEDATSKQYLKEVEWFQINHMERLARSSKYISRKFLVVGNRFLDGRRINWGCSHALMSLGCEFRRSLYKRIIFPVSYLFYFLNPCDTFLAIETELFSYE